MAIETRTVQLTWSQPVLVPSLFTGVFRYTPVDGNKVRLLFLNTLRNRQTVSVRWFCAEQTNFHSYGKMLPCIFRKIVVKIYPSLSALEAEMCHFILAGNVWYSSTIFAIFLLFLEANRTIRTSSLPLVVRRWNPAMPDTAYALGKSIPVKPFVCYVYLSVCLSV